MAKRNKDIFEETERSEVRINKMLADAGICSRRGADELIASGRVKVNGEKAEAGMKVTPDCIVTVDGKQIGKDNSLVLIAVNKPRGIVCTTDTTEPDNIIDFLHYGKRIFPIGRLDKDSEGLLLLTNDGDIVNKILRAGNNHEKEYIVTVNKQITSEFIKGMSEGVPVLDTVTDPCYVEQLSKNEFRIILTQGLNRQIRRMCEYFGYSVSSLIRVRIMNINLGRLKTGDYRNVTDKELEGLKELLEDSSNEAGGSGKVEKKAVAKTMKYTAKRKPAPSSVGEKKTEAGKNSRDKSNNIKRNEENKNGRNNNKTKGTDSAVRRGGKSLRAGKQRNHK